jgi:hypothetical protein
MMLCGQLSQALALIKPLNGKVRKTGTRSSELFNLVAKE